MSSLVLAGDTSGQVTLASPAVAGSNTATLPTATGELSMLGGTGQAWQSVTRTSGTTYTNTTGKPICVFVTWIGGSMTITVNGVALGPTSSAGTNTNTSFGGIIVPPSASYIVTLSSGTMTVYELR